MKDCNRHVPLRTCVACRAKREKKDLFKIVRLSDGTVAVDETHSLNGRGMYLCKNVACVAKAKKTQALHRHLKVNTDLEIWERAEKFVKQD